MKITTSIVFEMKMSEKEIEVYKALPEKEREARIEEMKDELANIIADECVEAINFTEFSVVVEEGE